MEQNEEQKANPKETIEENLKENTPEQGKTKEDKEIKVVEKPKEEKKIKFEDLFTRIEDEEKKEEIPKKIEVVIEEAKADNKEIPSFLPNSIEDYLNKIQKCVNDCLYDEAKSLTKKLKELENFNLADIPLKDQNLVVDVEETTKHIEEVCQYLNDEEGWFVDSSNSFVTTKYKKYPNSNSYTMKMEGELNFPVENMLSIVYEIEYFNEFVPFCDQSYSIKQLGKGGKLCYFILDIPFWSNREGYIRGFGVDRININNTILIISKTIDEDKPLLQRLDFDVPPVGNAVRLKMDHFCFEVTPITRTKFRLRSLLNMDPRVPYVPQFVINFFARKIGSHMFSKLLKLAEKMDEKKWAEINKKEDSKEYYEWIGGRIELFENNKKKELEKAEELEKEKFKPVRI